MKKPDKYADLLMKLLAIPALSRREEKRADFLEAWFMAEAFSVRRVKNNLVVTRDNDPATARLLLNSHIDTVPPGDGWSTDPYQPVFAEGKITGLGSNDAGASVVSLIAAYENLDHDTGGRDTVLVISAEEEIGGASGITSVLSMLKGVTLAIVGEPTGMQPAVAERGLMVIDAVASGVAGHAARNEGQNALYRAIKDIERIRNFTFSNASQWLPDPSVNVTMIRGGSKHNVVPDRCEFVIDARSNDRYSNRHLLELLREACDAELTPRSLRLNSSFLPVNHPLFFIFREMELQPFGSPTLSDMALMPFPAVKIGPGDSARSHTANEYILESEINSAIQTYGQLISAISKKL